MAGGGRACGGSCPLICHLTTIASTSFSYVAELRGESGRWVVKWSRDDRAHPELDLGHEILFYDKVAPSLPLRPSPRQWHGHMSPTERLH